MTERQTKIKELKASIKEQRETLKKVIEERLKQDNSELPEEEIKVKMESFKEKMGKIKIEIQNNEEELTLTRMNKTGSKFFEWHPHKGMNRRQARVFRRQTKGKLK